MFHVGAIESPFAGEMYVHVSVMWGTRSFAAVVYVALPFEAEHYNKC